MCYLEWLCNFTKFLSDIFELGRIEWESETSEYVWLRVYGVEVSKMRLENGMSARVWQTEIGEKCVKRTDRGHKMKRNIHKIDNNKIKKNMYTHM